MAQREETWLRGRIEKLERRLRHQRDVGKTLPQTSIIRTMNDRAVIDMEVKLFNLRRQVNAFRQNDRHGGADATKGEWSFGLRNVC